MTGVYMRRNGQEFLMYKDDAYTKLDGEVEYDDNNPKHAALWDYFGCSDVEYIYKTGDEENRYVVPYSGDDHNEAEECFNKDN